MRTEREIEFPTSPLEWLEELEVADRYWLAFYEPLFALMQYHRLLAEGRKPN
ncbi:MAG: hypothetical protein AB7G35_10180 [Hyphomicrobiaceae bacterium]